LLALLLCILLVGIFIFLYMLVVKPEGTLTVTYSRIDSPAPALPDAPGTLKERLSQLDAAREAGVISPAEFEAKRAAILDRF
jgi:hypothetical protein